MKLLAEQLHERGHERHVLLARVGVGAGVGFDLKGHEPEHVRQVGRQHRQQARWHVLLLGEQLSERCRAHAMLFPRD